MKIRQPDGFKQAGFSAVKIEYSRFYAHTKVIRENVIKNAPFRPVTRARLQNEYARIDSRLPF